MDKIFNKDWFKAAAIRAIKTIAQTALSMISIGMAISDIDWLQVLSISIVAGVFSILTSIAGLPELKVDGTVKFGTDGLDVHLNQDVDINKNKIILKIEE